MTEEVTPAAVESTDGGNEAPEAAAQDAQEPPEVRDPAALLNAYNAEKAKRKEQDAAFRDLKAELDSLRAKAEGKEAEHAAALEAQRVKDEAIALANERILKAEIRAAAAGKLTDPADALRYLDMSEFEVGSDGEVDASQIAAAVTNLITSKPYLAAQGGKKFEGSADGGVRNGSTPAQLSRDDLTRMTAEQITAAKAEGRLNDLLGIR